MAEICGLGAIGKNGLIFHSAFGPRLMLGGIVTTALLPESTWPARDHGGCPEDCFVCRDICPAGAIDGTGKVDRPACAKYSMQSPLLSLLLGAAKTGKDDIQSIFNTASVGGNAMYTCTHCVSGCPKC
jgi:epoxyqueuosine reductase